MRAPFNIVIACGATMELSRRAQGTEFSGWSKDSSNGIRVFRFWIKKMLRQVCSDSGDGYQPLIFS